MTNTADPTALFAADGTVLRHPERPELKYSLPKAVHHFRNLMRNKDDTTEVFKIYESLPSKNFMPRVEKLALSERGEYLRRTEPSLPEILDNHAELRKTPKGSLAHAYCDFMETEGLTAAGLVAEAEATGRAKFDDLVQWFSERSRDTHDMYHVLTGYGRDALGEQCVLLFTHGQMPTQGHLLIGYAGALNIAKDVWGSKAPVMAAAQQAKRTGRGAPPMIEQSILELLPMQLEEVRAKLNIPVPTKYQECHRIWREEGIDPFNLLSGESGQPELKAA